MRVESPDEHAGWNTAFASWEKPAHGLLLAWFAARIAYFAFHLGPDVPPDEATHFGRVLAYAAVWGVPANGPETYELGLLDHRPWLYYWFVARSLALNVFGASDLVFARCVNGAMGLATAGIGVLWVRAWCRSPFARVLFTVIVTNTLMFTGLAGSVSYDNGTNLLAAASVLALTRFRLERSPSWLLALAALLCAGCLTKRTFLPLAGGIALLLLFREWRRLPSLLAHARQALATAGPGTAALLATSTLLASCVVALYGSNLVDYGTLAPGFEQVVGDENAMRNRIYARNRVLDGFRTGEFSYERARSLAATIHHDGDRAYAEALLDQLRVPELPMIGRAQYALEWSQRMLSTAAGYTGHRAVLKQGLALLAYLFVFAIALGSGLGRWRPGLAHGVPADAAILFAGYAFVLLWWVNYPTYQTYREFGLSLQGRYLFPVLVPFCGLVAWSLADAPWSRPRAALVGGTALWFLYGDLPWLLQRIDARWLMHP